MITAVEASQLDLRPAVRAALSGRTAERGLPAPSIDGVQPVVITGPITARPGGPVIVAVDDDAHPGVLLRYGWDLANHLGVALRAVYVWTDCRPPECAHHRTCHRDLADAERLLATLLDEHLPQDAAGRIEREVVRDSDVGPALASISSSASLLVVASCSDEPGKARGSLGSSARTLLGSTACPLVVVPHDVPPMPPARW